MVELGVILPATSDAAVVRALCGTTPMAAMVASSAATLVVAAEDEACLSEEVHIVVNGKDFKHGGGGRANDLDKKSNSYHG